MNIVVLCAGTSTEREVSIKSGYNVCEALRTKGHNAVMVDVFKGTDADVFEKAANNYDLENERDIISSFSEKVPELVKTRREFFGENVLEVCKKADIVFMALHGENGENGKCQAAFDLFGIKYTGSGYLASAIGMDKGLTKQVFKSQNVPTAKSVWIYKGDSTDLSDYSLKIPVVVKACNGGSSVGVVLVKTEEEYQAAIAECYKYDDKILIEEYIEGREFSVGVVNNKALPIVEIIVNSGWYDYKNKYLPGATSDECPANLTKEQTEKMQKIAEDASSAIGCSPYVRVDIMMDKDDNMYCLEVNTLPGMTATSLIPQEAQAIGMDFPSLCEYLVNLSLEKYN
ncbi:MAG: D-alanine--D-alanine ligase [Lachnospiraceae bacterium]|nr:D-alanine--D-alanine ligase [Lachnospiraceae bacterium]